MRHAGERLQRLIEQNIDHAERYRRVYITQGPRAWSVGATEHRDIVDACLAHDPTAAATLLATHLSRTALTVFMLAAPEHDPAAIRAALSQVSMRSAPAPDQPQLPSAGAAARRRSSERDGGSSDPPVSRPADDDARGSSRRHTIAPPPTLNIEQRKST